jgi:hypothetical protein
METIKDNPQAIELEVAGIWSLIEDQEKATALLVAYKEANAFVGCLLCRTRCVLYP